MLKLAENPPILHPQYRILEDMTGRWWVAHTKARNEKALARSLCSWDINYFLPLVERVSSRHGRRTKSLLPLFNGYLFFCGSQDDRYLALTTNRIARVIEVADQQGLVRELAQIHRALQSGKPIDRHRYLKKGTRCRVKAGPLAGLEGIVERRKGTTRLILRVGILGQAAAVEIDADLLDSLD